LINSANGKANAEVEREAYDTTNKQIEGVLQKAKTIGWNVDRCLLGPSEWRFSFGDKKKE